MVEIPGSAGNISRSEKNTISVEIPGSVEENPSKSENNISNVNLIDLNLDCYVYKKNITDTDKNCISNSLEIRIKFIRQ